MSRRLELNLKKVKERLQGRIFGGLLALTIGLSFSGCGAVEISFETFWTDQFNNPDNRAGYHAMGEEILDALDGRVDTFIQGVGTGGCFSGVSEVLKKRVSNVECIAIEPANSRALSSSGPFGGHRLEGMGAGFKPSLFRDELADDIVPVSDELAMETARKLARVEGVLGGISSGANVSVALERARQMRPDQNVVTVICDSGLKYLQGDLFSGRA